MKRLLVTLLIIAGSTFPLDDPATGAEIDTVGQTATLPALGEHWVWIPDRILEHSLLFDGDRGEMLGSIPSASMLTPKLPLVSRARREIYSVDLDYDRGRRGKRTDYVTIYDAETLGVKGDIVLPHPTSESNTSLHHATLLDDDRFLVVFSQFPTTVATVVDLVEQRVVSEVSIAGCAGVYATGPTRFATLCGDGTVTMALLDGAGRVERVTRSEPFFDVVDDPVSMAGVRLESTWLFATFSGTVHPIDFATESPRAGAAWPLVDDRDRDAGWRPGGLQPFALHRASKRLYALMHQGGPGTHKDAGPEIWVYDVETATQASRIEVPNLTADFLGTLLEVERDSFFQGVLRMLIPSEGAQAIAITQDDSPILFARHGELGVVAVLDAESGEHLRNLDEVGLAGPSLGVP